MNVTWYECQFAVNMLLIYHMFRQNQFNHAAAERVDALLARNDMLENK